MACAARSALTRSACATTGRMATMNASTRSGVISICERFDVDDERALGLVVDRSRVVEVTVEDDPALLHAQPGVRALGVEGMARYVVGGHGRSSWVRQFSRMKAASRPIGMNSWTLVRRLSSLSGFRSRE